MSIKIFNPNIVVDAVLKRVQINEFGTVFAINYECDGFSIIDINTPLMPDDVKTYLEGDDDLLIYAVPTNISKLGQYALATFKNIETIYLFKNDELMDLDLNTFGGLENLESVYVPEALYDSYVSTYPTLSSLFKKLVSTYVWEVPFVANPLSVETFDGLVGMLTSQQIAAIGKIKFNVNYNDYEFGVGDKIFNGYFPVLETIEFGNGEAFIDQVFSANQVGMTLEVE